MNSHSVSQNRNGGSGKMNSCTLSYQEQLSSREILSELFWDWGYPGLWRHGGQQLLLRLGEEAGSSCLCPPVEGRGGAATHCSLRPPGLEHPLLPTLSLDSDHLVLGKLKKQRGTSYRMNAYTTPSLRKFLLLEMNDCLCPYVTGWWAQPMLCAGSQQQPGSLALGPGIHAEVPSPHAGRFPGMQRRAGPSPRDKLGPSGSAASTSDL